MIANISNSYPVGVNYGLPVRAMVKGGKYDWASSDINSRHFPPTGKGKSRVRIRLVHSDRNMESDEVLRELDRQNLRPVTLPELLALGAKYPDLQRQFPIVAKVGYHQRDFPIWDECPLCDSGSFINHLCVKRKGGKYILDYGSYSVHTR
jgi:hypothetical protein